MDEHLKALADISLQLTTAEAALEEGAAESAREALDVAAEGLAALRERWPALGAAERAVVGPTAAPLRRRLDAARARLPRRAALSIAPAEADPEQELEPES